MKIQMSAGERFRNLVRGKAIDRLPVIEWAPWWNLTLDRWRGEGLPESIEYRDIQLYFGLDGCVQTNFRPRTALSPKAPSHGAAIMKSREDYEHIKKTLYPDPSGILNKEYLVWLNKTRLEGNTIHWFTVEGFFWYPRTLFGIEPHLYSFYDEPDLLQDICSDYAAWLIKTIEYIGNTFQFDYMSFAEDMSYNHGPMLGKDLFDQFLLPWYKKIIPLIKKMDVPVFIDSDGDITLAVDWYAEAGAEGMFPLERQAGVDVGLYIEKQPEMCFLGHFDKTIMKHGEEAMRKEFERILPSCVKGKVIPSVDHQTPPDVSIETYRLYVKLLKEYAGRVSK
jgi:hypothetical protein